MDGHWVYILASANRVLYIGVTNDLHRRLREHSSGEGGAFTKRYRVRHLVHAEQYGSALEAIEREKQLKRWKRAWKVELIEKENPEWDDLSVSL